MATELKKESGQGPEIIGMRINVFHLMPYFLDPTVTEEFICQSYNLTPEQVASARAYALNNAEAVLARHYQIEARNAAGNPPSVLEAMKGGHERMMRFKDWMTQRDEAAAREKDAESSGGKNGNRASSFPSFKEWLAAQESPPMAGS